MNSPNGSFEFTAKSDIEKLCAKENERKWHQTEDCGSQLLFQNLIRDLGHHGEGPRTAQVLNGTYVPPPDLSSETLAFLQSCQSSPDSISLEYFQNDLITRFKHFNDHGLSARNRPVLTISILVISKLQCDTTIFPDSCFNGLIFLKLLGILLNSIESALT